MVYLSALVTDPTPGTSAPRWGIGDEFGDPEEVGDPRGRSRGRVIVRGDPSALLVRGDPFLPLLLTALGAIAKPILIGAASSALTGLVERTFGGGSAPATPLFPSSTGVTDPLAAEEAAGEYEEEEE